MESKGSKRQGEQMHRNGFKGLNGENRFLNEGRKGTIRGESCG